MYEIQAFGNRWSIVDDHGEVRCVGPLYECEAWLDARDNALVLQTPHAGPAVPSPNPRTPAPNALPWAGVLSRKLNATLCHLFSTGAR